VNEQQSADFFSEQVGRLLRGEPTLPAPAGDEGLQDILGLANELAEVRFQASPGAQAAFQQQLEGWFGPKHTGGAPRPKHGRWNTMSGKLLALIISILVTVSTGAIAVVITILVVIRGFMPGGPTVTPTPTLSSTPPVTQTATPVPSLTATVVPTQTVTGTLVASPTVASTVDTIEAITVVVTIEIGIDELVPGLLPGDHGDHDDDDHDDHDRGHGNDPDHHDEDNPGHDDD